MVQAIRVLVTGASELPEEYRDLARELGRRLMSDTNFVLVTGGLKSKGSRFAPALDGIVADAARQQLGGSEEIVRARIETILPESDHRDFERFHLGTEVRVSYANLRMRRHSMVLSSDAVIAVNGGNSTAEIIDLAYLARKPLLPIPLTAGAARTRWNTYRGEISRRFRLSESEASDLESSQNTSDTVSLCLRLLGRVLRPRCFVAMRFVDHPLPNTFETIRSVVDEMGYEVIRTDEQKLVENVVEEIWTSIRHSNVVIADLTGHSANVYYELGISHALAKTTLLLMYSPDGSVPSGIPFDISTHRILPYGTTQSLRSQLKQHLR